MRQLRVHCNLKSPLPDVTPVPVNFNYDAHAKFEVAQHIHCRFIAFYWWYVTLCCDIHLWPSTLNIYSILAVLWSNSLPNLSEIKQSAAELLPFEYLTLWPWTCITCCAILRIVCTKLKLSQAIPSRNVMIILRLMRYVTQCLTFDPLTLKVCCRSGVTWL